MQQSLGDAAGAGVIVALAIGDQGSIDTLPVGEGQTVDAWQVFAATGTTHLMSHSYL